jgi:hypothetical protein
MKIDTYFEKIKKGAYLVALFFLGNATAWSQTTTFNSTGGIQTYLVPAGVSLLDIEAVGAQGGAQGGLGASMQGQFTVTPGETLTIIVGEEGFLQVGGNAQNSAGGGGGSFIYNASNTLLVAAGGGGGRCPYTAAVPIHPDCHGQVGPDGGDNSDGLQIGGTAGNGGQEGIWSGTPCAGGGTGWLTPGGVGLLGGKGIAGNWVGGDPYCAGGGGGCGGIGGFGGGGGGGNLYGGGGGGGGYSGGAGGNDPDHGGGGGSYSIGTGQINQGGVQTGNGYIVIVVSCTSTVLTPDVATLLDVNEDCISTPTAPTAMNDCGATIMGTPDVSLPITTVGTTVVTWTYDDGVTIITQTQNVIITGVDVTPPVLDNPTLMDMGGQCDFTPPYPTATDVCTGSVTGVPNVTFPMFTQGTTVITWSFDDGNGNVSTQTQNITLNDVAAPALDVAVLTDYTGCNSATPPAPTATDYCAGSLNGVPDVSFPITAAGPTTVTWTYDDGNGNVISQTQDVYVTTLDVGVTVAGTTLTSDAVAVTYQWIDCGTSQAIVGETNQSYTPTVTGNYAVEVIGSGCTDTSQCILVDYTGLDELMNNDKELVMIIDFMGRETKFKPNTPLIFIYSDGTRERVMEIEE